MQQLLGVRAAARQLGLAPSTVSRQVRDGIIPNRGSAGLPLIDVAEASAARDELLDHGKGKGVRSGEETLGRQPGARGEARTSKRERKLDEEIRRLERENAEKERQLVAAAGVAAAFAALAGVVQRGLAARARDLAAHVAGEADINRVLAAIEAADRKILEAMRDAHGRGDNG